MTRISLLIAVMTAIVTSGCSGESSLPKPTGKGAVRAINAISTSPAVTFLIEERQIGTVDFKRSSQTQTFDDLDYTFNFEVTLAGDTGRSRIASQYIDFVKDKDYTIVLGGSLNSPELTLWEADLRSWGETETVFQLRFAHTAPSLGQVDVYFAAPEVTPQLGQQVATLAYGEIAEPLDFPSGDYILTYTPAGDPDTVLFASATLAPTVRTASIALVFDADANDVAPLSVRFIDANGTVSNIGSPDYPPTLRLIQASNTVTTADVYIEDVEDVLTTPDVEGHAFGDFTGDITAATGANYLTYTSPGDTSAILFEATQNAFAGNRYELFLIGDSDTLTLVPTLPDRRPVESFVKLSIMHASIGHPRVNVFVVEADGDLESASPLFFRLLVGDPSARANLLAGSRDVYVEADDVDRTVLAGPYRLDIANGDVIQLLLLDNVSQPDIVDIVPLPLP
jgi:hypothetical protein